MKKKKILFMAMQMSIHTARWINQLDREKYDVHLFPVNNTPMHPLLKNVTLHKPIKKFGLPIRFISENSSTMNECEKKHGIPSLFKKLKQKVFYKISFLLRDFPYKKFFLRFYGGGIFKFGESDAQIPYAYGPKMLAQLISILKPDLVHSLEFQTCGYNVMFAKKYYGGEKFPPWLATNWGSDIYFYRNDPRHLTLIKDLLQQADYYSCECERDAKIARELGYKGVILPVMPNTGGIDTKFAKKFRDKSPPSSRKLIMVKGYQNFAGRALTALDVVEKCASQLKGYHIIVYSVMTYDVAERVQQIKNAKKISIKVLPYTQDHYAVLKLFSEARIYLGVSISDAISTSLLESMAMGAFPIQTATACCDEWIKDGQSGLIIDPHDQDNITKAFKRALSDDEMVDKASDLNWKTILTKADKNMCTKKANEFYDFIFKSERT